MSNREKQVARERIPRELTQKVEKGIRENAKRGYPLTARELSEKLARELKDARVTTTRVQNFEARMPNLPARGGSRHKGKWMPV
ncbi:MAG: hypothetical protein AAB727_03255, partial [Patescibacteria group bacterium]